MRVGLISLGCAKNQVDAEKMLGSLKNEGFEFCNDPSRCDIIIINTCGFIEEAKQESINNILEICSLKSTGLKKVVVTGCLAERYKQELTKSIPEIDVVVGLGSNKDIGKLIQESFESSKVLEAFAPLQSEEAPYQRYKLFDSPYAYLKVADGCNNRCSYCAIPQIRGPFRSRRKEDIIAEAQSLVATGSWELNLVAQDTTSYGTDIYGEPALPELLRALSEIDGLKWLRLLYCYPDHITEELLEAIAKNPKIVKYIDIPLQHVNGEILAKMNRRGNFKSLRALIAKIRQTIPNVALRTTFIVGFPGETKEQFTELCDFAKEIKFERLGCFPFSKEEGTDAGSLTNQTSRRTKLSRVEKLMALQAEIAWRTAEGNVGKIFDVLVEGTLPTGECWGRTYMDAPEVDGTVSFKMADQKKGEVVKVKIEGHEGYKLFGSIL
ncbi:MAG: 30S ribosomal protein S12 methylthiotransferase RimO [Oscillospiraceae bacterium]|jgi:ribosomal protein S12 methylthiotransferase|nr:30S ribosomal protein S12 methylthiotransferase RimO [Oscillospiraceae bacterium]